LRLCQELGRHPVGRHLVVLPALVAHHVALVVELLLGQGVQQEPHPVGLQEQHPLQVVRRDDLEVVGAVLVGRGVQVAAGLRHVPEVHVVADVLAALEHHVLEQVGEAGPARLLVLAADVVPHADADDRDGVVLVDEDIQAVGELHPGERQLGVGRRLRSLRWGRHPREAGRRLSTGGPLRNAGHRQTRRTEREQ
jgi:hypothetical protein